jgi:hypothetical protein
MTSTRRRTRPLRKPSTSQQRRRRPKKTKIDWSDNLIKFLIGLVLVVDLVLIYFVARQCSKPAVVVEEPTPPVETRILQIEVLNGCGVSGIANEYTDYLRGKGFDVVKTDNYESFNVLRTVVIDRRGNIKNGVRIAEALGLGEDRVLQEVNEAYLIDATVILGKDYRQLEAWQLMED